MIDKNSLVSRSANNLLKIFFELLVIIHHLYCAKTVLGSNIRALLGPVAVGGFLFCSGYGIGISYKCKGDAYLKKLSLVRMPSFYLIIIITNLFYLAMFFLTGENFSSFGSIVVSIFNLQMFSGYVKLSHWLYFISDLMLYYLLFVASMLVFKKRKNRLLLSSLSILILCFIIIAILSLINHNTGSTRYLRACVLFPIGIIFSIYNDKLFEFIKQYKLIVALSLLVVGITLFAFLNNRPMQEYLICSIFVLFFIVLLCGISFKSKIIDFSSKLVIYVYLSHELFLNLTQHYFPTWSNWPVMLMTIFCSIISAIIIFFVKKLIFQKKKI